jgi:hypothetical protein
VKRIGFKIFRPYGLEPGPACLLLRRHPPPPAIAGNFSGEQKKIFFFFFFQPQCLDTLSLMGDVSVYV